jgi:lipid A 3-O-deacylase
MRPHKFRGEPLHSRIREVDDGGNGLEFLLTGGRVRRRRIRHEARERLSAMLLATLALCATPVAGARELLLSMGAGPQPGGDQTNRSASVDFSIRTFERSARQHISIGVVYTRLETDTPADRQMNALSIYPEFSYFPAAGGRIREAMPPRVEPYFFTRFLGPSYISENTLGDRHQEHHFAFLAQLGVGMLVDFGEQHGERRRRADFRISWKHFSNAHWFDQNDGIDVPFVVSMGVEF